MGGVPSSAACKGLFKDPVVGTRKGMVWTKYVWMASRWWVFYVRDYPRCMWVSSMQYKHKHMYSWDYTWVNSIPVPTLSLMTSPSICMALQGEPHTENGWSSARGVSLLVEFVQGVVVGRGTIQSWWVGTLCKPMKGKIIHGIWMANNLTRVVMILDQFWSYDYLRTTYILSLQNEVIRFAW